MSEIRALIPAAGVGTRMRPLTHTRPKVLLPLAGRPLIGHLIADLVRVGITDITIVIGYFGDKVQEYCRSAFPDVNFRFREQAQRLGLGHAVGEAIDPSDTRLLIVLGDTLFRGDLGQFSGDDGALGLVEVDDPRRLGIAVVEQEKITFLEEKPENPRSNLALAGVYYVPDAQLLKQHIDELIAKELRTRGEYQITDALQRMLEAGHSFRPIHLEAWYDAGMPETLIETNRILLDTREELNHIPPGLRSNNVIIEPCAIDDEAQIEHSVVGPHVHIGKGSVIRRSLLRNSIIGDDCEIQGARLDGAALGQEVRLLEQGESLMLGDHSSSIRES